MDLLEVVNVQSEDNTYSVHSFNAVSSLLTVCWLNSSMSLAVADVSMISPIAATALATT